MLVESTRNPLIIYNRSMLEKTKTKKKNRTSMLCWNCELVWSTSATVHLPMWFGCIFWIDLWMFWQTFGWWRDAYIFLSHATVNAGVCLVLKHPFFLQKIVRTKIAHSLIFWHDPQQLNGKFAVMLLNRQLDWRKAILVCCQACNSFVTVGEDFRCLEVCWFVDTASKYV